MCIKQDSKLNTKDSALHDSKSALNSFMNAIWIC